MRCCLKILLENGFYSYYSSVKDIKEDRTMWFKDKKNKDKKQELPVSEGELKLDDLDDVAGGRNIPQETKEEILRRSGFMDTPLF